MTIRQLVCSLLNNVEESVATELHVRILKRDSDNVGVYYCEVPIARVDMHGNICVEQGDIDNAKWNAM